MGANNVQNATVDGAVSGVSLAAEELAAAFQNLNDAYEVLQTTMTDSEEYVSDYISASGSAVKIPCVSALLENIYMTSADVNISQYTKNYSAWNDAMNVIEANIRNYIDTNGSTYNMSSGTNSTLPTTYVSSLSFNDNRNAAAAKKATSGTDYYSYYNSLSDAGKASVDEYNQRLANNYKTVENAQEHGANAGIIEILENNNQ